MGTRAYAEEVCAAIDPGGKIFGNRILSRDESGSEHDIPPYMRIVALTYWYEVSRRRAYNASFLATSRWWSSLMTARTCGSGAQT